jgi:tetratricopeptide (TPR) repeat protein
LHRLQSEKLARMQTTCLPSHLPALNFSPSGSPQRTHFNPSQPMPEISEKELPQNLRTLWLKALSAVQTDNHSYAISLLQAVLKDSPGFLDGRKMLRKCEISETGGAKKKGGLFGIQTSGLGLMKIQSHAKKDPEGALPLIEKELEKDPLNEGANDLLFDTFIRLDLLDSAAFALETIRKGRPEATKLLHKLAQHYLSRELPQLATEVYNDILKQAPNDSEAIKGSKDSSAKASMQKGKWDENADIRTLMKDQQQTQDIEQGTRSGLTKDQLEERRDRLAARYNEDNNNLALVKDLAAAYEQLEDWENALTFYDWAHTLSQGDIALKTKASVMRDRFLDCELKRLDEASKADPDNEDLKQQLADRKSERISEQVEDAKKRVEQNPTDPQLRYDLGLALYNSGDHSGAIPHLQQATRNPHIRTRVLLLLGRTFRAKGMFDLSIKQLSDALADLHAMDNTKKEVLYEKGTIHAQMGNQEAALDCFKQIYEVDYGYRDVAQRVESSYHG